MHTRCNILVPLLAVLIATLVAVEYPSQPTAQAQGTTIDTCPAGAGVDATADPGLAADCVVLLNARDVLIGTGTGAGTLNWSGDRAMSGWYGVGIGGSPQRVHELVLAVSGLTGVVPESLGQLGELRRLELGWNSLSGKIPPALGNLTKLWKLNMSNNQLSGSIPSTLGGLSNVRELNLGSNRLSGAIPKELGDLSNLEDLRLYNNRLSGKIPPALGNLTKLLVLDLSINRLSGGLPPQLAEIKNLRDLLVRNNQLSGKIPPKLGELTELKELWLHNNRLFGEIPPALGNLTKLERLLIHNNRFSGEIPEELGDLLSLKDLRLDVNILTGCIPVALRPAVLRIGPSAPRILSERLGLYWCDMIPTPTPTPTPTPISTPTPVSRALISRIVPPVRSITLHEGDIARIDIDVYGVQNILDNSLADDVTFEWNLVYGNGSFYNRAIRDLDANKYPEGRVIMLTIPDVLGNYTLTASLDRLECQDLTEDDMDDCTAVMSINVRREGIGPEPTAPPLDPPGEIPSTLVDDAGNEYVVFSPTKGGKFESDTVSISAKPGAVPDGELIGVRSGEDSTANCEHTSDGRAMLQGSRYRIDAVDVNGRSLKSYPLKSPVEVCVPLPFPISESYSSATLAAVDDFCDLTLLNSQTRLDASGFKVCGTIGELPITVAAAITGPPIPTPTAPMIEVGEAEELPDTGGSSLPNKKALMLLLVILGCAIAVAGIATYTSPIRKDGLPSP